jgi:hypothetical protein
MRRKVKLEHISKVAERGLRYIIPQRERDWFMLCLKNASDKRSVEVMMDFVSILRMLSDENTTIEEIDAIVDLGKYKWVGADWLAYQVCKYSPRGEELVETMKLPISEETKERIKTVLEENKTYSNTNNTNKR